MGGQVAAEEEEDSGMVLLGHIQVFLLLGESLEQRYKPEEGLRL